MIAARRRESKVRFHRFRQSKRRFVRLYRRFRALFVYQIFIGERAVINRKVVDPAFVALAVYPVGATDVENAGIAKNIRQLVYIFQSISLYAVYIERRIVLCIYDINMRPVCSNTFFDTV